MKEFEFIKNLKNNLPKTDITLGIGDDASCIDNILIAKDIAIEDIHFTSKASIEDIVFKIITANVSDICAMGGKPKYILMGIGLPKKEIDLISLTSAITTALKEYKLSLIGGDTTSSNGKIFISVTILGYKNKYLLTRSGAKPGDLLFLSRTIGLNHLSLCNELGKTNYNIKPFLHYRIKAEVELGNLLGNCEFVTSCIDISDGLISEAYHIAESSKVSIIIGENKIPVFHLKKFVKNPLEIVFRTGEEYALLFTVNKNGINHIKDIEKKLNVTFFHIGNVVQDNQFNVYISNGNNIKKLKKLGFEHEL
jgi:thiamine-monophosphate kinase